MPEITSGPAGIGVAVAVGVFVGVGMGLPLPLTLTFSKTAVEAALLWLEETTIPMYTLLFMLTVAWSS